MIIKNYGRYWKRESINWGKQGRGLKGHLKGYDKSSSDPVDFKDQMGIYVLYDDRLQPIYVGQAKNRRLFTRLKDHDSDGLWNRWAHFSWFGFRGVNISTNELSGHDKITKKFSDFGFALLDQMEGILIAAMEPHCNKQGAKWKGATEYYQFIEDDLETPSLQYLARKLETIEEIVKANSSK